MKIYNCQPIHPITHMKKLTITLLVGLLAPGFALAADTSLEIVSRHKAVFSTPPKKIPSVSSVDAPLLEHQAEPLDDGRGVEVPM